MCVAGWVVWTSIPTVNTWLVRIPDWSEASCTERVILRHVQRSWILWTKRVIQYARSVRSQFPLSSPFTLGWRCLIWNPTSKIRNLWILAQMLWTQDPLILSPPPYYLGHGIHTCGSLQITHTAVSDYTEPCLLRVVGTLTCLGMWGL